MQRPLALLAALLFLAPAFAAYDASALPTECTWGMTDEHDLTTGRTSDGDAATPGTREKSWVLSKRPGTLPNSSSTVAQAPWVTFPSRLWAAPPPKSNWISPDEPLLVEQGFPVPRPTSNSSDNGGLVPIPYEYTITFKLKLTAYADPRLSLDLAAAKTTSLVLNGQVIASQVGDSSLALRAIQYDPAGNGAFVNGMNTLVARVISEGTQTGLLVAGTVRATCDPPPPPIDCSNAPVIDLDLSTGLTPGGTVAPPFTQDSLWRVVSYPLEPNWGWRPAWTLVPHPNWLGINGAAWIDPWNSTQNTEAGGDRYAMTSATVPYIYEVNFTLDLARYPGARLNITFAADDRVSWQLNGNDIGAGPPLGFRSITTLPSPNATMFVQGVNSLRALVINTQSFTGLVARVGLRAVCGAPPIPCAQPTQRSLDLSTGVDVAGAPLAPGSPDPRWQTVQAPRQLANLGPAHVIRPGLLWVAPPGNTSWINPWTATGMPLNDQPGGSPLAPGDPTELNLLGGDTYIYETRFDLDLVNWTDIKLFANFSGDEREIRWWLNGVWIGGFGPDASSALHPIGYDPAGNAAGAFRHGSNTLRIEVHNRVLWTGLLVAGGVQLTCNT